MPRGQSLVVVKNIQTLFRAGTAGGLTDGQLLERFLSGRDGSGDAAFAAIVERHAPMVLRICRDALHDWHDAEDASQAAFIVLARKASSIQKLDSIASWLFGVACRVAAQARAKAARRRRHEQRVPSLKEPGSSTTTTSASLGSSSTKKSIACPSADASPLVLCYLKGYSQTEAAARLGCPVPTLQNRLARGQQQLRTRLTRHDLSGLLGLQAKPIAPHGAYVAAPVPAAWLETTVRAALDSAHHAAAAGAISAPVVALTDAMLGMMLRTKLKSIAALGLCAVVVALGMGLAVHRTAGAPPREPRSPEATAARSSALQKDDSPRAEQERFPEIIVRAAEIAQFEDNALTGIIAIDPKTAKWRPIFKGLSMGPGPVSPDGRFIVYSSLGPDPDADQVGIWIYDITGEKTRRGESSSGREHPTGRTTAKRWLSAYPPVRHGARSRPGE